MKRTRAQRQAEAPYTDPVTGQVPTQPLVLTACGHPVDASYLPTLETRAREQKQLTGYCCPVCDRVSSGAVRNFALEEVLKLEGAGGPVLRQPAPDLAPRPLAQEPEFEALNNDLRDAIERARNRPFRCYKMSGLAILGAILPELGKSGGTQGKAGPFSLSYMRWNPTRFLRWIDFGEGRYRTEFRESHGLELEVVFGVLNEAASWAKQGDSPAWWRSLRRENYVFDPCTRAVWEATTPEEKRVVWFDYRLVAQ